MGKDFGAVIAVDRKGSGEGGFGYKAVVDSPGCKETGCVGC